MKRAAFGLLLAFAAGPALAQAEWPARPIRLIVPFTAGSSSDIVARIVAQKLGERLKQQVFVENRVGASGNLGSEAVARAEPDGYTMGLANASTHAVAPSLSSRLAYDPVKDFAPVSMLGSSPFVLSVFPGLPAKIGGRADRARPGQAAHLDLRLRRPRDAGASLRRPVREDGADRDDPCALSGDRAGRARPDGGARRHAVRHYPAVHRQYPRRPAARARDHRRGSQRGAAGCADHRRVRPAGLRILALAGLCDAGGARRPPSSPRPTARSPPCSTIRRSEPR